MPNRVRDKRRREFSAFDVKNPLADDGRLDVLKDEQALLKRKSRVWGNNLRG